MTIRTDERIYSVRVEFHYGTGRSVEAFSIFAEDCAGQWRLCGTGDVGPFDSFFAWWAAAGRKLIADAVGLRR